MDQRMWESRTKSDLIIEVWEKLDCESVGASEIEAIETAVREQYGQGAVDSPMIVARLLADEGAVLRHPEILEMSAGRLMTSPYDAMFRNVLNISTFNDVKRSISRLENLRRKFSMDGNAEGLRMVRDAVIEAKERSEAIAADPANDPYEREFNRETAEWFRIWLHSPEVFEQWIGPRMRSKDFTSRFGNEESE